jgi:hypothetical protein
MSEAVAMISSLALSYESIQRSPSNIPTHYLKSSLEFMLSKKASFTFFIRIQKKVNEALN